MMIFGFFFTLFYSVFRLVFLLIAYTFKAIGKILMFLSGCGVKKHEGHRI